MSFRSGKIEINKPRKKPRYGRRCKKCDNMYRTDFRTSKVCEGCDTRRRPKLDPTEELKGYLILRTNR